MDNLVAFPGMKRLVALNDNVDDKALQRVNAPSGLGSKISNSPLYYDTAGHILIAVEQDGNLHVIAVPRPKGQTIE